MRARLLHLKPLQDVEVQEQISICRRSRDQLFAKEEKREFRGMTKHFVHVRCQKANLYLCEQGADKLPVMWSTYYFEEEITAHKERQIS